MNIAADGNRAFLLPIGLAGRARGLDRQDGENIPQAAHWILLVRLRAPISQSQLTSGMRSREVGIGNG